MDGAIAATHRNEMTAKFFFIAKHVRIGFISGLMMPFSEKHSKFTKPIQTNSPFDYPLILLLITTINILDLESPYPKI